MGRELNMDTQRQNFWKESIHKEATVRLSWHMKYSREFARTSSFQPKPVQNGSKNKFTVSNSDLMQLASIKAPNFAKSKRKPAQLIVPEKDNENKTDFQRSEMRPVTPGATKLLYKGFSALGEGRYAYLQKRKEKKPEEKYEFPITSGWEYGWKISDSMKNSVARPAEFGRTRIVKDSFYRTNGVMPIQTI